MAEVKVHQGTIIHENGRHNGHNGHHETLISAIPKHSEVHTNGHHRENGAVHSPHGAEEAQTADAPAATEAEQIVHIRNQIHEQKPPQQKKKAEVVVTHDLIRQTQQDVVNQLLANRTDAQRQRFTREDAVALVNQYLANHEVYNGLVEVNDVHIEVAALERQLLRQAQAEAQHEWEKNLKFPVIEKLPFELPAFRAGNPTGRLDQDVARRRRQRQAEEVHMPPRRPAGENTYERVQQIMNDVVAEVLTPEVMQAQRHFTRADIHRLVERYRTEGRAQPLDNTIGFIEIDGLQISQQELEDRIFNFARRAAVQQVAGDTREWAGNVATNIRENLRVGVDRARDIANRTRAGAEIVRRNVTERVNDLTDRVRTDIEAQQEAQVVLQTTAEDIISWLGEQGWDSMTKEIAAILVNNYIKEHGLTIDNGVIDIGGVPVRRSSLENQIFIACGDALGRARRSAKETVSTSAQNEPSRWQKLEKWWTTGQTV